MKGEFLVGAVVLLAFSSRLNATGVTIQSGTTFELQAGTSLSLPGGSLLNVNAGGGHLRQLGLLQTLQRYLQQEEQEAIALLLILLEQ